MWIEYNISTIWVYHIFHLNRSKGRIASGLLHAKAGILRAGANILAQKANALDKVAQAIPGAKVQLINQLQVFNKDKGGFGGGGYGAPTRKHYSSSLF